MTYLNYLLELLFYLKFFLIRKILIKIRSICIYMCILAFPRPPWIFWPSWCLPYNAMCLLWGTSTTFEWMLFVDPTNFYHSVEWALFCAKSYLLISVLHNGGWLGHVFQSSEERILPNLTKTYWLWTEKYILTARNFDF